jgi:N6-L-threonylcarbamoyladenine synthase
MIILGIESSCDDTSVAILDMADGDMPYEKRILAHQLYTQFTEHEEYGGVVPEIASRAHLERMNPLVEKALAEAEITLDDIDAFAVTQGPGLLGGLLVAVSYVKSLALATGKPFIGVNHLEGHALTAHLTEGIDFPYLLLLASGGHCQFMNVKDKGEYETIGATLDDAAGEVFDKVAKMLDMPYPGGPHIEKLALKGNPDAYDFPVPLRKNTVEMSFSGLKTAVRMCIRDIPEMTEEIKADICASFQNTVAKTLVFKAKKALDKTDTKQFVLAGGVAANKYLRASLEEICKKKAVTFYAPPIKLCTDNAVMIAYAGGLYLKEGKQSGLDITAIARWPLDNKEKNKNA